MLDDIEADIAAALNATDTAPAVEPAPAVEVAPAPVETTDTPADVKVDATGRAHAKDGKFAPKDGKPPAVEVAAVDPAAPQVEAPKEGKHKPHSHWSPEMKAHFMDLPEGVQKAWLDREADMDKGRSEWATKAEDFNRINKIIEPMRGRWAMQGLSPDVAIGQLVSAANLLQQNPREGFEHLLKTYAGDRYLHLINDIAMKNGYALTQSDNQGQQPTQGQQPAMADPTVRRLEEQIQHLTQKLSSYDQREADTVRSTLAAEVNTVRNDPKNLFFENVKDEVAMFAQRAMDSGDKRPAREIVQEAYDRAVWANPTTRSLQMQANEKAKAQADQAARQQQVNTARQASVSVTGSPGQGAPVAKPAPQFKNRLDDIEADIRAVMESGRA